MKLVVMREFVILKDSKFLVKRQIKDKYGNVRNVVYENKTDAMRQTTKKIL